MTTPGRQATARLVDNLAYSARRAAKVCAELSEDDLLAAATNRDRAETERQEDKPAVDHGLQQDSGTLSEMNSIQSLMAGASSLDDAVRRYVERLGDLLAPLDDHLYRGCLQAGEWTVGAAGDYWSSLCSLTAADNAHAMYLSSGNWGYSVLRPLLNALDATGPEPADRNLFLTGGQQDARVAVILQAAELPRATSRPAFLQELRASGRWLMEPATLSALCWEALEQANTVGKQLQSVKRALAERWSSRAASRDESTQELWRLYGGLFNVRIAYDTYEYFGAYALYRHVVIPRLAAAFSSTDPVRAARFKHFATFYQYELARREIEVL